MSLYNPNVFDPNAAAPWMTPAGQQQPSVQPGPGQPPMSGPSGGDPWANLQNTYGLGTPPAQGMPASMPGVQLGQAPQMSTDMGQFNQYTNQINGQIQGAYGYQTPQGQAAMIDPSQMQHPGAQQMGTSPELQHMLSGEGYSPANLARMRATATEAPAQAGLQQMSQMKRMLGESGISGGADVALRGEVARQTGQNQSQALNNVELQNANMGNANQQFGVGQQTGIGMGNMQQANQMALANANQMFQALTQNQQASNSMTQMNTGLQANQQLSGANASSGFLGQQGAQGQQQRHDNETQNNQNVFARQTQQGNMDWDKQKSQWQELNNRYGQAQNTLGSWGGQ